MSTRPANNLEIEVKIPCGNIEVLHNLGSLVLDKERHFEDNWMLDTADAKLKHEEGALRVRIVNSTGTVTYKGRSDAQTEFKARLEYETEVEDPDQMLHIFERLGYKPFFRYQKYRTVYRLTLESGLSLKAMFDETPMGNFLELEGSELAVKRAVEALKLTQDDYITDTYIKMQLERCRSLNRPLEDLVFESTT